MTLALAMVLVAAVESQANEVEGRTVTALVTAYCPCRKCCGRYADGITSTGRDARKPGCAVDPARISYGSRVHIPGVGWRLADDTGSAMRASGRRGVIHIDVRMRSHAEALRFGTRRVKVRIVEDPVSAVRAAPADEGVRGSFASG